MTQKISKLEKKLTNYDNDKYITTPEFNTLAADFLMQDQHKQIQQQRQILMLNCQVLTEKLPQVKQKIYLLKISRKN